MDHSHIVDLGRLVAERGPGTELNYEFKRSMTCPGAEHPGVASKSARDADGTKSAA